MIDNDGSAPTSPRRHIGRLAVFAASLLALFYLAAVKRVIDVEEVRRTVAATGPAAPLTYVVVSAVLGAVFVPGPILAAGSGLLFGAVLGVFVTLGATVGTAVVASLVGRRAGRDSARALLGTTRADRVDALIDRRGLWAVVGQRFIPGLSDALVIGIPGDRGVVRDRHRQCVRCATWIPKMACARRPRRRRRHPRFGSRSRGALTGSRPRWSPPSHRLRRWTTMRNALLVATFQRQRLLDSPRRWH